MHDFGSFRRNRDAQLRATINQKLIETGERDRYVGVIMPPPLIGGGIKR